MKNASRQNGRMQGFFLLEVIIALVVASIFFGGVQFLFRRGTVDQQARQTAEFHNAVKSAAELHIRNVYATVIAGSTGSSPFALSVPMLQAAGYLQGYATTNRYGQTPCVLILQPVPNQVFPVLVLEGGSDLTDEEQTKIAGYMKNGARLNVTGGILRARANTGIANIPMNNFITRNCSGTAASGNRVASLMNFDLNTAASPVLYNTTITGNTNANTMFTNLNMAGNNITNIGNANAATVNATTVNAVTGNFVNLNVTGNVNSDCLVARSDPNFFVCPAANSNVNTVVANGVSSSVFTGRTDPTYNVIPDLNSNMNTVVANTVTADRFVDKNNGAFFVDPAADSTIRDAFVTDRSSTDKLSYFMPNFVEREVSLPLRDGQSIGAVSCLGTGITSIYLIPQNIVIPPNLIIRPSATLAGSNWVVNIRDGVNAPIANSTYFAKLGCYYA